MTPQEQEQEWAEIVADDFEAMQKMLSDIQIKLMGVHPRKQFDFCRHFKYMILEAWQDANNPDDSFLFPKPPTP